MSLATDVFDVYIQQDQQKVWLVDFNPFAETTDGLLYEWDELLACKCMWIDCSPLTPPV